MTERWAIVAEQSDGVFKRLWRYLGTAFGRHEESTDPKVRMLMAIDALQQRHLSLCQSAAAVIGQQRAAEMALHRATADAEKLQESIRQARLLADDELAAGNQTRANELRNAEQSLLASLHTAEQRITALRATMERRLEESVKARNMIQASKELLNQKLAERDELSDAMRNASSQDRAAQILAEMESLAGVTDPHEGDLSRDWLVRRYIATPYNWDAPAGPIDADAVTPRLAQIQARLRTQSLES